MNALSPRLEKCCQCAKRPPLHSFLSQPLRPSLCLSSLSLQPRAQGGGSVRGEGEGGAMRRCDGDGGWRWREGEDRKGEQRRGTLDPNLFPRTTPTHTHTHTHTQTQTQTHKKHTNTHTHTRYLYRSCFYHHHSTGCHLVFRSLELGSCIPENLRTGFTPEKHGNGKK
jgi:hypothetical protein